ncbi:MAG: hypothetical protein JNL09_00885 [Anaerolineales bacterium]|nr:hypothetical protein [Anaerolineales bacterium]
MLSASQVFRILFLLVFSGLLLVLAYRVRSGRLIWFVVAFSFGMLLFILDVLSIAGVAVFLIGAFVIIGLLAYLKVILM